MTTKKFIKFPSIEQFRNVVTDVKKHTRFQGLDENNNPIVDKTAKMPKIKFKGTVKLHGTNAGVCYNNKDKIWCQSRKNIITPEKDNAGFAFFVSTRENSFVNIIEFLSKQHNINLDENTVSIYGEFCGDNIQKNVAITGLDKMFVLFAAKVTPMDESKSYWIDTQEVMNIPEDSIYNIDHFATFEMEIDFENVHEYQNKLIELTTEVEEECPVGKYFGRVKGEHNTTGEGIVWKANYKDNDYIFKVKGEKHSNSKVKTLKKVDNEEINRYTEFANSVCKSFRLEQAVQETFDTLNGGTPDIKGTGDVIRWTANDILKEEKDLMRENSIDPKKLNKYVAKITSRWFKDYLMEF